MTQKWDTTSYAIPTSATAYNESAGDLIDGVDTARTRYYGTADPSSGASWDADQLGVEWVDSTNEIGGAGDDLGAVVKVWSVLTDAPTYGWLTRNARAYIALEPNVNALDLSAQSTAAFADLDLTGDTSGRAIAVLIQVDIEDSGSPAAAVNAEFRKNGTTTDARERRIYPQAAGVPNMTQMIVELDVNQTLEYALNASGAGTMELRIDVLGYFERAE